VGVSLLHASTNTGLLCAALGVSPGFVHKNRPSSAGERTASSLDSLWESQSSHFGTAGRGHIS
jgi:hypothetical protein